MKKLFYLIICIAVPFWGRAQFDNYQIYQISDGSQLTGKIILKDTLMQQTTIQLANGGTVILPSENILSGKTAKTSWTFLPNGRCQHTRSWYLFGALHSLSAERARFDWDDRKDLRHGLGVSFTGGYKFYNALGVGIGTSVDFYEVVIVPTYIELRGNINKGTISPFYNVRMGYSLFNEMWPKAANEFEENKGGWMFYPAIGLEFNMRKAVSFSLDTGYNFQQNQRFIWDGSTERIWYKSFALRAGLKF